MGNEENGIACATQGIEDRVGPIQPPPAECWNVIHAPGRKNNVTLIPKSVGSITVSLNQIDYVGGVGEFDEERELEPRAQLFGSLINQCYPLVIIHQMRIVPGADVQNKSINARRLCFFHLPFITGNVLPVSGITY